MARRRAVANTSKTLAHFLLYLRITHVDEKGLPSQLTQGQLARKLGYKSPSVISELEDPKKCRATYEHLERYADYFKIPAGVILLITRITSTIKYGVKDPSALGELAELQSGLIAMLSNLDAVKVLLDSENSEKPEYWEPLFQRLAADFRSRCSAASFQNSSSRAKRKKTPTIIA